MSTNRSAISTVPYLPGLDGLRAIAVLAVIAYHADAGWLPGGFLGVEVFFVVSGYLITLLLLAEHERTGRIDLKAFWARRARRLLPALFTLLIAAATLSAFVPYLRASLARLRDQLLFAFLYVSNWFQIVDDQSYFDATGRPPLLRHLWSLAVEEQFYVIWPLVMVVVLTLFRRHLPMIGVAFLVGSVGANVLMAVLYNPANPNRVYLGTDTRAGGLLLGAGLAMLWRPYAVMRGPLREQHRFFSLLGAGGLLALALMMWRFHDVVATGDGQRGYDLLYRGGFFLVGLATAAVILSTTHLSSRFGQKILGARPLAWLGTRSYGLYLWHWPVFQLTRPGALQDGGDLPWPWWAVLLLRVVLTASLTELSYRLIEVPIRTRKFKGWLRAVIRRLGHRPSERRRRLVVAMGLAGVMSLFTGISVATAKDAPTDVEASLTAGQDAVTGIDDLVPSSAPGESPGESPTTAAAETTTTAAPDAGAPAVPAEETTTTVPETTIPAFLADPIPIFAVGDSVMLGAAPDMGERGMIVDAKVSRQAKEGVEIVRTLADNDMLGDVLVVHLGTNGPTTRERFDEILQLATNVRLVILITVKAPKSWAAGVNEAIFDVADEYPNVRLLDWNGLSQSALAPADVFYGDGIHLRPAGRAFYTQLIIDTIAAG